MTKHGSFLNIIDIKSSSLVLNFHSDLKLGLLENISHIKMKFFAVVERGFDSGKFYEGCLCKKSNAEIND